MHHDSPIPCVDAPLICEALIEVPSAPYIDESLLYIHDRISSDPFDLEVDMSIVEESRVHAPSVSFVESHSISLHHCYLLSTAFPHAYIDACDVPPLVDQFLPVSAHVMFAVFAIL